MRRSSSETNIEKWWVMSLLVKASLVWLDKTCLGCFPLGPSSLGNHCLQCEWESLRLFRIEVSWLGLFIIDLSQLYLSQTPSKHLSDTSQTPSRYHPDTHLTPSSHNPNLIQTPSKHFLDTFQVPSRHLPDNYQTTFRQLSDNFQTTFRRLPETWDLSFRCKICEGSYSRHFPSTLFNPPDIFQKPDTILIHSRYLLDTLRHLPDT